jgi:cephalosporin hydroxylase
MLRHAYSDDLHSTYQVLRKLGAMAESDIKFSSEKARHIAAMAGDRAFRALSQNWMVESIRHRYSYNFSWLGLPIIQYPADIIALQELVWRIRPGAIIETGVARGGSLIFYASLLELLGRGQVIGVEVALAPENREAIEGHPLSKRIRLVDGSSIAPETIATVTQAVQGQDPVLVILDSHHTHSHVMEELRGYAPLVKKGSYIAVLDTVIEHLPPDAIGNRPWKKGDNPMTAAEAFVKECDRFEIDHSFDGRLLLSVAPKGFLRCIRD